MQYMAEKYHGTSHVMSNAISEEEKGEGLMDESDGNGDVRVDRGSMKS